MGRIVRSCIQSSLKLMNSVIGMVGIAMILYSLWMFRIWQKQRMDPHLPPFSPDSPAPWFIYTFLGIGITMCVITCSGYIAAETANGCCLYAYMLFVFLLLMVEAAVTADVFLNHNWEEDFPEDPTGNFNKFKDFIRENFATCKWIALSVVAVEGLCMLLALVLKAFGPLPERYYHESDDEDIPDRVPLLKNYVPPPHYIVSDPAYGSKSDSWNIRIDSKASR